MGKLTTHVLDTSTGKPASAMCIDFAVVEASGPRLLNSVETNADGRTDRPLIGGRPVPIGRYELTFGVGDYFTRRHVVTSDPPFLDSIPLRFSVSEPEGHLHVPLLVTPWSYATYRGS